VGWIANYWQWVAHWSNVSYPTLPQGWTQEKTIVWQNGIHPAHSWVETVIGASGNVDHNYFFGTIERLKEILQFPTTPPPSGDCTCEDEISFLIGEIARVEDEVNFLKVEIYNLQQSQSTLQNSVNTLESGQNELYDTTANLDVRLQDLEALEAEFRRILCKE
jgi:hypothetical protein